MKEYFLIAKIVSVFGKDGFVKIVSYSDFPERFSGLKKVYIDFFGNKKLFNVESVTEKKGTLYIKFSNFSTSEEAGFLTGREVFVDESDVIKLPESNYFVHDLIGSKVMENEQYLGIIADVLVYPANDVYVIQTADGKELLIPAVKELILSFNPESKLMILKPGSSKYDED